MPTRNANGRSRRLHNGWPLSDISEPGWIYLLHFLRPLGSPQDRRGHAQHYTGWAALDGLAERLGAHWDGTSDARLVVAFRRAGIPFLVASIEPGTRALENRRKLHGAARRCPVCRGIQQAGQLADSPLTEPARGLILV
jgi:hypothetical protein